MSEILRFNFVFQDKSRNIQVAAERNSGKLMVRCYGFLGMEDSVPDYRWDFIMDEGDWDKLDMALEDNNTQKWESSYMDTSVENAPEWSLEIHTLGKHTISEGYNRFPKEFETFKEDLLFFIRLKRRQLKPGVEGFKYLAVAETKGLTNPIVFIDRNENTFAFYNLLEDVEDDGTYFMDEGDWETIQDMVLENDIFSKFTGYPKKPESASDAQYSITVGYKQGQITQRFRGDEPDWWDSFANSLFNYITMIFTEGRKAADGNITVQ